VEFRDRSAYQYFEVPAEVHGAFMTAASKGSYFNRNIRGRLAYVRLPSAPHCPCPANAMTVLRYESFFEIHNKRSQTGVL
jgi:hypothetical protein